MTETAGAMPDPDDFLKQNEENKAEAVKPPSPVIHMPVFMFKNEERIQVGEATIITGDDKFAVHLNSESGREVAKLISSNLLSGISLGLTANKSLLAGLN